MATLDRVADRQAALSETANYLKKRLDFARWLCFGLSIGGATLAAIASGLPSEAYRPFLAWPAAGMLAISTFVAARLLSKDSVMLYVKARMAAEALKREAFLFATSASPYEDPATREPKLVAALGTIEANATGLGLVEQKAKGSGSCPRNSLHAQDYITSRLDKQINYYRDAADKLMMPSRLLHRTEFVLAGTAAIITAVAASIGKGMFDVAALTAVITTLAGTVLAHLQAARYDEHIVSYRATADRLADLKATAADNETAANLAKVAEEIISAETQGWQALWVKGS